MITFRSVAWHCQDSCWNGQLRVFKMNCYWQMTTRDKVNKLRECNIDIQHVHRHSNAVDQTRDRYTACT